MKHKQLPQHAKLFSHQDDNVWCRIMKPVNGSTNIEAGYIIHDMVGIKGTSHYITYEQLESRFNTRRYWADKRNERLNELLTE